MIDMHTWSRWANKMKLCRAKLQVSWRCDWVQNHPLKRFNSVVNLCWFLGFCRRLVVTCGCYSSIVTTLLWITSRKRPDFIVTCIPGSFLNQENQTLSCHQFSSGSLSRFPGPALTWFWCLCFSLLPPRRLPMDSRSSSCGSPRGRNVS